MESSTTSVLFAGESGTGKSSLCLALATARGGRSLIVNSHDEYSDRSHFTHVELAQLHTISFEGYQSIVIEDIGFPSALVTRTINRILTYVRRHNCVNIFMVTHALSGNCIAPLIPHFCFIVIPYGRANRSIFFRFVKNQAKEFLLSSEVIWAGFERESLGASLVFSTQTRELRVAANSADLITMTSDDRRGGIVSNSRDLQQYFRTYYVCESQSEKEAALVLTKYLTDEVKILEYLDSSFNLEFSSKGERMRCNILDLIRACSSKNRTPTKTERLAFKAVCVISEIPRLLVKNLPIKEERAEKAAVSSDLE